MIKNRYSTAFLSCLSTFMLSSSVYAATLTITYDFGTGSSPTFAPNDANPTPGITVSSVTGGSGADLVTSVNPSGTSGDNTGYNLTSPMISIGALTANVNSLNNAEAANVYFSFTITPDVGTTFSLDNISFLGGRSASSSTRQWGLYSEPTGFTDPIAFSSITATRGNTSMSSFDESLSGVSELQNIATATEIRFYINPGTGSANNPGRKVDIDSIVLTGTTVIPEPQTVVLVLFSGGLCVFVRQYRKRKAA